MQRKTVRNPNDLLLTFRDADKQVFTTVSNEYIITKIVSQRIRKIKKAVQYQWDWERYEDTKPEEQELILDQLKKTHLVLERIKMWVQDRFQIRHCWFCEESHAAGCKLSEKIKALEKERDEMKLAEG